MPSYSRAEGQPDCGLLPHQVNPGEHSGHCTLGQWSPVWRRSARRTSVIIITYVLADGRVGQRAGQQHQRWRRRSLGREWRYIQDSHWSSSYITGIRIGGFLSYLPEIQTQSLFLKTRSFLDSVCSTDFKKVSHSLQLCNRGFHAQKGSIIGALMP